MVNVTREYTNFNLSNLSFSERCNILYPYILLWLNSEAMYCNLRYIVPWTSQEYRQFILFWKNFCVSIFFKFIQQSDNWQPISCWTPKSENGVKNFWATCKHALTRNIYMH